MGSGRLGTLLELGPERDVGVHRPGSITPFGCTCGWLLGWRGKVLAWWAIIGLFVTAFAFIGVNMFLSGLHSYGQRFDTVRRCRLEDFRRHVPILGYGSRAEIRQNTFFSF